MNGSSAAVTTPDGKLQVSVRGDGPCVLLVHGLTASGAVWRRVAGHLEGHRTVVVPDLLGRGASDAAPGARFRLADETERLGVVAAECAPGPLVVVGHSHGAALALSLAGRLTRCRALCLVDPVTPWTRRPAALALLRPPPVRALLAPLVAAARVPITGYVLRHRVLGDPTAADGAMVGRYADPYADVTKARTLLRVLADWHPGELSPHLPHPPAAVVLTGERDRRAPPALARRLARHLGCELRIVAAAGHALPEEAPDEVARAIEDVAESRPRP